MKNLVWLIIALTMISCQQQTKELRPESIFNVATTWQQQDESELRFDDLKGKVLVTTMVFTSCKTSCPRLIAEMKSIATKVGKVDPSQIRYIFISIDPTNDSPEVMRTSLQDNKIKGKEWLFIRSNEQDTRALANLMSVRYKEISPMEFSHSNTINVYSKEGLLRYQKEGFNEGNEEIVKEIKKLIKL